jgi:hypothetical protein
LLQGAVGLLAFAFLGTHSSGRLAVVGADDPTS